MINTSRTFWFVAYLLACHGEYSLALHQHVSARYMSVNVREMLLLLLFISKCFWAHATVANFEVCDIWSLLPKFQVSCFWEGDFLLCNFFIRSASLSFSNNLFQPIFCEAYPYCSVGLPHTPSFICLTSTRRISFRIILELGTTAISDWNTACSMKLFFKRMCGRCYVRWTLRDVKL